MNGIIENNNIKIEDMIYEIRGIQVILDSDLSFLYGVETKRINEAIKNNPLKFPERFAFRITEFEYNSLKSINSTSKGGSRKGHTAFTEQGVAMISTILKSKKAINVSIQIIDAFVLMRKYISSNLESQKFINNMVMEDHENLKEIKKDIKTLQDSFNKFEEKKVINEIYFQGQIYDAYSKIIDIMNTSKNELIIIDAYLDKSILDMISKVSVSVLLITRNNDFLNKLDIFKYQKQYNNLKIIYNNTFHDRYIIVDSIEVYHLGASINHAGSKTFSINILTDKFVIQSLINKVKDISIK